MVTEKMVEKGLAASVNFGNLGNGYHIYLPVQAFILELESVFSDFEQPSNKFLRFSEKNAFHFCFSI